MLRILSVSGEVQLTTDLASFLATVAAESCPGVKAPLVRLVWAAKIQATAGILG